MKLLVDMGNSRMKWATVSKGSLSQVSSLAYDEFAVQCQTHWQQIDRPEQVWVSSVANDQHWALLTQTVQALWGLQAERIAASHQAHGVSNVYTDAEKLGSDRWAALVAVHQRYSTAACIVDCGTALTVDGISAAGQHLGGVIVPGVEMMQSVLQSNTAAISALLEDKSDSRQNTLSAPLLGADTRSGIINGSWLACMGVVEKVYVNLSAQNNDKVACVITGGNAPQLAELLSGILPVELVVDTSLVLKGLAIIAGEK